MLLEFVPAEKVRDEWVGLGPCLAKVRSRCNEKGLPGDIYLALRCGSAFLYLIQVNIGFVIFQRHMDPDGPVLFVWIIYGELAKVEDDLYAEIEALAVNMQAKRVRMHSPRKGWQRRKYFQPVSTIYEREL